MDGLRNIASNLMTSRDKQYYSEYTNNTLSVQDLLSAYQGAWLPQKIVDIPAYDACRMWREWDGKSNEVEAIVREETRMQVVQKVMQAIISARLYGGSALYIGTGDSDLKQPLNPKSVGKGGLRALVNVPRYSLNPGVVEQDIESPWFGQPKYWSFSSYAKQIEVHPSRIVIFYGHRVPQMSVLPDFYWGDSVLQAVMDAVKQSDATSSNVASLVFEAKVDVIAIPNLMDEIGDAEYERKLTERLSLANLSKGINGMLIRDAEESFEQKKMQFTTLPEVMDRFFQNVAGAADIPMTRLFGMSPGGMNSTGDSDLKNYYDKISSVQELDIRPALQLFDEVLVRSALGYSPRTIGYSWRPLWQLSKKEAAEVSKTLAEAIKTIKDTGVHSAKSLAEMSKATHYENGLLLAADKLEFEEKKEPNSFLAGSTGARPSPPSPLRQLTVDAEPRTLYVRRDVLNVKDVQKWARSQGLPEIHEDLHVTIAYSRTPVDWFKMGHSWQEKIEIPAGGPRQFGVFGPEKTHVVLRIACDEVEWRHDFMKDKGASWDWPEYEPHVSLFRIAEGSTFNSEEFEPYQGRIVLGPEIFEEVKE